MLQFKLFDKPPIIQNVPAKATNKSKNQTRRIMKQSKLLKKNIRYTPASNLELVALGHLNKVKHVPLPLPNALQNLPDLPKFNQRDAAAAVACSKYSPSPPLWTPTPPPSPPLHALQHLCAVLIVHGQHREDLSGSAHALVREPFARVFVVLVC